MAGGRVLEVVEGHGDQGDAWKQLAGALATGNQMVSEAGYKWFIEPQDHGLLREALQEESWGQDTSPEMQCARNL